MAAPTTALSYPGARRPDRRRTVDSGGLGIAVYEWGDSDAPPLLLAHGGFDFAGTFDAFAPRLADAGWRVVAWDQRGHGDSTHAVLYNWDADVRDALAVLDSTTRGAVPIIGHSKGGGVVMQLADACPHRVSKLVNLDGLPSKRNWPDVADHERTRLLASELAAWLSHRRSALAKERKAGTIDELAARRGRMNPRLPMDWLRYLVPIGAREDDDGWRWKLDPVMRFGGFGPWRPEWSMVRMASLAVPVLGVLGLESEDMGWGTQPDDVEPFLPPGAEFVPIEGVGHFVHIEQPELVAALVLDFLGPPPAAPAVAPMPRASGAPTSPAPAPSPPAAGLTVVHHNKVDLALHQLHDENGGHPLLVLHGLGERSPGELPTYLAGWPGAVYALDLTGHGGSTVPAGGGYTAEILMADADAGLAAIGEATVLGRGLGAYVALLVSGARPDAVRGAILADGPGITGGGNGPGSSLVPFVDPNALVPPDPFALVELSRDIRPPDYATSFARLATHASPLDEPIAVSAVNRPDWLAAVVQEPGVVELPLADALAFYAT
jgi:pimeloyl-ACP methyl ester carboxylesterase